MAADVGGARAGGVAMKRRRNMGGEGTRVLGQRQEGTPSETSSHLTYRVADYSARLAATAAYGALALLFALLLVLFPPTGTVRWPMLVIGIRCLAITLWLLLACFHALQARRVRLIVTPRGPIYHRIGSTLGTTWDQIGAVSPHGVVLAHPADLGCPWWNWSTRCRDRSSRVLPLARFDSAWPGGRLGADLRRHAPWWLDTTAPWRCSGA